MRETRIAGTDSALARSWLDWGVELPTPRVGCVVVLWRNQPDGLNGHVGLFLRTAGSRVHLWGGNQLGTVRQHHYPHARVLGYRWPVGTRE